jgi:DNA-binding response OmpR family regulator
VKILLVDDDVDLLDVTAYALRREGFNVIVAADGEQALQRWERDNPDVVVTDVFMPRRTGFEVCQRIRQASSTPVILLTAADSEQEVIQGFELGADDHIAKPFSPRQLAMRIRAVWRRSVGSTAPEPTRRLQVGDFMLDVESHEVSLGLDQIQLTPIEFGLLHILAANPGRVIPAERLVDFAWGYDGGDVSLLKTHVCHLRKKLQLPRGGIEDISSVPRVGYRLAMNVPVGQLA